VNVVGLFGVDNGDDDFAEKPQRDEPSLPVREPVVFVRVGHALEHLLRIGEVESVLLEVPSSLRLIPRDHLWSVYTSCIRVKEWLFRGSLTGCYYFGMDPAGMAAWYYQGDGLKLWEKAYAVFNLVPRPGQGNTPQMGGWFRRKINTIGDYKGLKMRIVNLGGKVYARAGATTVLTPAAEIYAALERGVIDAAEWVCPDQDMKLGLHRTAPYYYYPGWHEPGTTIEFGFNKRAYEALPVDLQRTLDHAVAASQVYGLTDFHAKNAIAFERLRTEFKGKVEILQFPAPLLRDLKKLAAEVVREESEKSPMARKVHASFTKFQALVGPWDHVAEGAYHRFVAV